MHPPTVFPTTADFWDNRSCKSWMSCLWIPKTLLSWSTYAHSLSYWLAHGGYESLLLACNQEAGELMNPLARSSFLHNSRATVANSHEHLRLPSFSPHPLDRPYRLSDKYSFTSSPLLAQTGQTGRTSTSPQGYNLYTPKRRWRLNRRAHTPLSSLSVGSIPLTPFHSPLIRDGANTSRWLVN